MIPIDFRNATFESLQAGMTRAQRAVLDAWEEFGPGTTRNVAALSGIDILTFRPRTTDLVQLGFVVLDEVQDRKGEGRYRALSKWEAAALFLQRKKAATAAQTELAL